MLGGLTAYRKISLKVRDSLWLVARPQMAVEWFRMWHSAPIVKWLRAADYFVRGDYSRAGSYYSSGLLKHPNHGASNCARMDLAYCYYRLNKVEESIELLDGLILSRINLRDAYLLRSKLATIVGNPADGMAVLMIGLEVFPDDIGLLSASLHINLTSQLDARQLHETYVSLLKLKQQLSLEDDRQSVVDTAIAHYELRFGEPENGDRLLARVLATGSAPYEAVLLRGERLLRLGRILSAREQLTRAMRSAPRNPRPVQLLAETYLVPGYTEEPEFAEQLASAACRLSHWENPDCIEVLAEAYERKADYNSSELLKARAQTVRNSQQRESSAFSGRQWSGRYKAAA